MQAPDHQGRNPAEVAAAGQHLYVVRLLLAAHTRCENAVRSAAATASAAPPAIAPTREVSLSCAPAASETHERGYAQPLTHSPEPTGSAVARVRTP